MTQKYNYDEKELLKGSSSQKTSQTQTKEPQNKKEGKERAITNPNAINGLRDIQPQSEEPEQRRKPPPQGPWAHPRATPPTQSCETAKKQKPNTPGACPMCPKLHRPPKHSKGLQPNPKIILPRQVISLRSNAKKQSFSDNN